MEADEKDGLSGHLLRGLKYLKGSAQHEKVKKVEVTLCKFNPRMRDSVSCDPYRFGCYLRARAFFPLN